MRKIKAGKRGQASKYVSRSKAIRKLQLSLKDFRRLCILKGVYPREAPKKIKKRNTTYYHLKDINFMALDPLITRMRQQKVYMRKYKTAKAKGDIGKIKYLAAHKPKVSFNHLVRERYPDFLDAVRDLEDPLSLMAMFSIFPTHKQFGLSNDKINICQKLFKHFELYVARQHCLKKSFVSIKGIYYQLEILGQTITYITPFRYPPNMPVDVDYKVMCTFLDFYMTLLKFVNFKLYNLSGWKYPPIESAEQSLQHYELEPIEEVDQDNRYQIDQEFLPEKTKQNLIFTNLHFYLSTEVPRESLEYIILACGGKVSLDENSSDVTHVITDREGVTEERTKEYVQPQWVYDCINFDTLLNVKDYWVGKSLPPHISPFVDDKDTERYMPEREKQLKGLTSAAKDAGEVIDDEYDVLAQKRRQLKQTKQDELNFKHISQNLMTNKDRKMLKSSRKKKQKQADEAEKLAQKVQTQS